MPWPPKSGITVDDLPCSWPTREDPPYAFDLAGRDDERRDAELADLRSVVLSVLEEKRRGSKPISRVLTWIGG